MSNLGPKKIVLGEVTWCERRCVWDTGQKVQDACVRQWAPLRPLFRLVGVFFLFPFGTAGWLAGWLAGSL